MVSITRPDYNSSLHKRLYDCPHRQISYAHFDQCTLIYLGLIRSAHKKSLKVPTLRSNLKFKTVFSFKPFTPPWFVANMGCLVNNRSFFCPLLKFYDPPIAQKKQFRIRSYKIVGKLQSVIAAFYCKEPQFAASTIDYLMNKCNTDPMISKTWMQNFKKSTASTSTRIRRSSRRIVAQPSRTRDSNPQSAPHTALTTGTPRPLFIPINSEVLPRHLHSHHNSNQLNGNSTADKDSDILLQTTSRESAHQVREPVAEMRIAFDDPLMHMDPLQVVRTPPPPPNTSIIYYDSPCNVHREEEIDPLVSNIATEQCTLVPKAPTPNHVRRAIKKHKRLSPLSVAAQEASSSFLACLQNRHSAQHSC